MLDLLVIITVTESADIPRVVAAIARMREVVLAEPGCLSWDAFHSSSDPHRIVLVERWASRELWEAHDALSGIQEIYVPEVLPFVTREIHISERLGVTLAG